MSIDTIKVFGCYEVQRTITRYLDVNSLKRLRLVNKTWKESAFTPLKTKTQVVLNSPLSFSKYFDFLLQPEWSAYFPNYKIVIKQEFTGIDEAFETFKIFWGLCSAFAKEITLDVPWTCAFPFLSCICYPVQTLNDESLLVTSSSKVEKISLSLAEIESGNVDKWQIKESDDEPVEKSQPSLSSLISLHLNISIVLTSDKKVFPFSWRDFFRSCQKLCHLSIQSDYASGHFYQIVNVLVEQNMTMKTLKIGTRDQRLFSEDFLRKLSELTTHRTETVSLGFLPTIRHDSPLNSILIKCSATLKHLTFLQIRTSNQALLSTFVSNSSSGDDDGQFPRLETFRVTKELLPNLSFLQRMPKLRRLEIFRDSTIGQHDNLSNPVTRTRTLSTMENLNSLVLELFVPIEDVWKLVKWFPNIQRLQMKVTDVIARIIFMSWKGLKELNLIAEVIRDTNDIVRCTLTDEGMCGILKDNLRLLQLGESSGNNDCVAACRDMAYIGDLHNLEVCRIQTIPDYQSGLTDHSVRYGLMDLQNLRSLTLVKTLISPAGAELLRDRGVSVTISNN